MSKRVAFCENSARRWDSELAVVGRIVRIWLWYQIDFCLLTSDAFSDLVEVGLGTLFYGGIRALAHRSFGCTGGRGCALS